ncbi:TRAP transporter small permease subunit [Puniceibacterium sp. IMCC21224]|uniref:TRAP transporter small permease subunit n=1 Tax=Puniceibacterium sp. IMCC21224 TaxID=1618204 RepID=UPI00064E0ADE|nr:TRAP transporter small permease [Puniceibacterium sp. IMCC21224]KMK65926.1 TRAP-type mannitol/chloroaromatic compound transport system, small permease component [Puniceibacterium sp. IMCC21224]
MQTFARLRESFGLLLSFCGLIAGALTFAVMCLVVTNVLMRYGFNAPVKGTLELTESALPLMIFLSLALTQFEGGHIKVVILTQHLAPGGQRATKVIAMLLGAGLFAWAAYAGWIMTEKSYRIGELERGSIRFPIWPIKGAVFFGLLMLSIQFLIDAIYCALGGTLPDSEAETVE